MKRLFRWLLWKVLRRDVLVLNPSWTPLHRGRQLTVAGSAEWATRRTLPITAPFHVPLPLRIAYQLHGSTRGRLRYVLRSPDLGEIGTLEANVQLPAAWLLETRDGQLFVSGQHLADALPPGVVRLTAEFTFEAEDGTVFTRRTGHRLMLPASSGSEYFSGAVYTDYEQDAAAVPAQALDALAAHRPLTGRLLDIGCATGLLVAEAVRRGLDAHGIDVSAWAVERANIHAPGRCRVLDIDSATGADFTARYDFITLHSVLEHVAGPERLLALVYELLASGGLALIQTLNADSLMHRTQRDDWSGFSDPTHLSPWLTADWLRATAQRLGFTVVHTRTYGAWHDNTDDEPWQAFTDLLQAPPVNALLDAGLGDFVEVILRKT